MLYDNILGTIGNTPMVRLNRMVPEGSATIYVKLEQFNPLHSVKDRIALAMVVDAERNGRLRTGMVVVEPTSGNTGIGLAMVCAAKGYRIILTMPESFSIERRKLLKALGAEIVLTSAQLGMGGAVAKAKEMVEADPNMFMPSQFENPANPNVHEDTTAKEILADLPDLDYFVAGVGTGGTITGVGRMLKKSNPGVKIVAVEPASSPLLSGGIAGPHGIQGIGANFIPSILDRDILDEIMTVKDEEAYATARSLATKEGILAGISSGAALHAALVLAKRAGKEKKIVVLLPDTGERYLSTDLFKQ